LSKEASKMRKVRSAFSTANPAVMFAQGVEQIISDKIDNPTNYHDYELNEMLRKEQCINKPVVLIEASLDKALGFNFINLLKDLIWSNRTMQVKGR
ncbi:MAG: hypothetical protein ACI9J2_002757, partial [Saprospiraceae bacterium]